jgi:hypothetical protein
METGLVIVALAGISFVWALIKWALKAGVNKGVNAGIQCCEKGAGKEQSPSGGEPRRSIPGERNE